METNFAGILLILFIGLKLANLIQWSWWWVMAPLWMPILLVGIFLIIVAGFKK